MASSGIQQSSAMAGQAQAHFDKQIRALGKRPKMKIGGLLAFSLISFALFTDLAEVLLGLLLVGAIGNTLTTVASNFIVLPILRMRGVKLLSKRVMMTMGVGFLIGLIPLINILPEFSAAVIGTILLERREDKKDIQEYDKKRKGVESQAQETLQIIQTQEQQEIQRLAT